MISKLSVKSTRKKSGECCYPKCECPRPSAKRKAKTKRTRKASRKKLRKFKASKWIDALALRPARCLLSSIMEYVGFLPKRIIDVFRKYFQQSVQTIYSKKFVAEKYRPQLVSKKMQDWQQHREWLAKRAQPKIDYSQWEKRSARVPFNKLSRYKYLSEPRWPRRKFDANQEIHFNQAITNVSQAAMAYKITERTLKLARVLERFKPEPDNYRTNDSWRLQPAPFGRKKYLTILFGVTKCALEKKCHCRALSFGSGTDSSKIFYIKGAASDDLTFSIPRSKQNKIIYYCRVPRAATKYKKTERTLKLARVLKRFKRNKYIYCYCPAPTVSSKVVRAKCSRRTAELAVPKQSPVEPKRKETKYGVAVSALAYNIKERTQFLAKPKRIYVPRVKDEEDAIVIEDRDLSEYGVSVTALKYVATNNILALATPKQPPVIPLPEIPYVVKQRTKYNIVASALTYKITDRVQKLSKPRHAKRRK